MLNSLWASCCSQDFFRPEIMHDGFCFLDSNFESAPLYVSGHGPLDLSPPPSLPRNSLVTPLYVPVCLSTFWHAVLLCCVELCFVVLLCAVLNSYCSPAADTPSPHYSYLREIDKLPMHARPEVFGLHSNANIVCEQNATFELFDTLLSLQVRTLFLHVLSRFVVGA